MTPAQGELTSALCELVAPLMHLSMVHPRRRFRRAACRLWRTSLRVLVRLQRGGLDDSHCVLMLASVDGVMVSIRSELMRL